MVRTFDNFRIWYVSPALPYQIWHVDRAWFNVENASNGMEFRHLEAILSQFEDALKGENLKRTWPLGSHCPNAKAVIKNRIFTCVVIPWFTLFDLPYSFLHKTSRNLLHCLDA